MSNNHAGPHKYIKKKLGDKTKPYIVWKCMHPGCTHYIKNELGEGRFTICWRCGDTLVLDKIAMELTRPHCRKCTRGAEKKDDKVLTGGIELLTQLFAGGGTSDKRQNE